ncbi:MAG: HAD-IG family 5'-nucleotidase [Polyangiales bacterium]
MSEQLPLPLEGLAPRPSLAGLPKNRRIYVNRNLSMAHIDWIGFDMDYTLAIYDQEAMDRLSIDVTAARLVKRGYPAWVTTIPYDTNFPIRGLLIDKKHGNVVKMDRYKAVGKAYRGFKQLSKEQLRTIYHSAKLRAPTSRYHFIDTLYALSEAAVYAGIIDAYDARGMQIDQAKLFADIREAIDEAHRDGTVYSAITSDIGKYIRRDPELAATLHKLRSAGKKLFVLTNSRRSYTELVMNHLLGSASAEYPTWRHYFDMLIVAASKPAFFQEHRPIMERVHDDKEDSQMRPAQSLERGKIYEGGNLHDLERMLGVSGDKILYVGDHIYGDILRSKKESAWRTAMIIQEMDTEVAAHQTCEQALEQATELEERRARLEDELRYHQARFKEVQRALDSITAAPARVRIEGANALAESPLRVSNGNGRPSNGGGHNFAALEAERQRAKRAVERVRTLLREIESETRELEARVDRTFHPYWGSLLKEGVETSSFGDQVEEYACLYTSRVSNFFHYSPLQTFRSPRDLMPHEL